MAQTASEVVEASDITFAMLSDPEAALEVATMENGEAPKRPETGLAMWEVGCVKNSALYFLPLYDGRGGPVSGNIQCIFREYLVHIQRIFSAQLGNTQYTFREYSVHNQGTFSAQTGNIQCPWPRGPVSGNFQCTFREHSRII
jgi:hypothetical protein